jgi:hypothetical protein
MSRWLLPYGFLRKTSSPLSPAWARRSPKEHSRLRTSGTVCDHIIELFETAASNGGRLMPTKRALIAGFILALTVGGLIFLMRLAGAQDPKASPTGRSDDAIADAQTPSNVPVERPEQRKTAHDLSDVFAPSKATLSFAKTSSDPLGATQGPGATAAS